MSDPFQRPPFPVTPRLPGLTNPTGATLDPRLRLLEQLIEARVLVAGDVLEVSLGVWAIHGSIPVDGEVILAEFSLLDEARSVLDQLRPNSQ